MRRDFLQYGGELLRKIRQLFFGCKKTLLSACIFPALLFLLLCFFDGWFSRYRMLGMGNHFLPMLFFLVFHFLSHLLIGLSFFYVGACSCLRERMYNVRLVCLCHCFFSHIWFLLLFVALSPFVSLICSLTVIFFAVMGCVSLFYVHPLPFIFQILNVVWAFMLFFANLGVLLL